MGPRVTLFIGLFLVALSTGLALAHLLQWAPKRKLGAHSFVEVQQTFYTVYGPVAGSLEMGSLAACMASALLLDASTGAVGWIAAALAFLILMFVVWAALIQPINRQVAGWSAESPPADWAAIGLEKWHALHAIRLALAAAALACLILAALAA
jgi:hypothetical protein